MKRILIFLLIAAITVTSLAGCVGNASQNSKDKDDDDVESVSESISESSSELASDELTTDTESESAENVDVESETAENTDTESETAENTDTEAESEIPTFDVKESTAGLKFELNEDKLSYTLVSKGSATATSIVIDGYKGLPVTKIGYMAFDSSTITSVRIGDYVREIDDHAFSFCEKLTSVKLGSGLRKIGDCAFRYCTALTTISIPSSVECIKWRAFYSCTALINITLPDTVTTIEAEAFRDTDYYKTKWASMRLYIGKHLIRVNVHFEGDIEVKSDTKTIAAKAFDGCTKLTGVVVPDSVEAIGSKAFTGCSSLATVKLGKGIKHIGEDIFEKSAFYSNEANWTNGLLYVGNYLINVSADFSGALNVADGTKVVASAAAAFCDKISSIRIPNSVVTIGDYAFIECILASRVTLGSALEVIEPSAFKGCIKLTNATFSNPEGWEVNGEAVDSEELSVNSNASTLLTIVFFDKVWARR